MRCDYCGSERHTRANCPRTADGQANRHRMRCTYCGARNHNVAACPKTWAGSAARAWNPETVADHFIEDGRMV